MKLKFPPELYSLKLGFTRVRVNHEGTCMDDDRLLLSIAATTWKFVLMGVAFLCLLAGFLLLGLGAMANKYKYHCLLGICVILIVNNTPFMLEYKLDNIKLFCVEFVLTFRIFLSHFIQEQKGDSKVQSSGNGSNSWRGATMHSTRERQQTDPIRWQSTAGKQTLPA